jgi:hypothetical protein
MRRATQRVDAFMQTHFKDTIGTVTVRKNAFRHFICALRRLNELLREGVRLGCTHKDTGRMVAC